MGSSPYDSGENDHVMAARMAQEEHDHLIAERMQAEETPHATPIMTTTTIYETRTISQAGGGRCACACLGPRSASAV